MKGVWGMAEYDVIVLRRDSKRNWEASNPRLELGEVGIEMDGPKAKVGNGIDRWTELPYINDDVYEQVARFAEEVQTETAKQVSRMETEQEEALSEATQRFGELGDMMTASMSALENMKLTVYRRLELMTGKLTEYSELLDARMDIDLEEFPNTGANIRATQGRLKELRGYADMLLEQVNGLSSAMLGLSWLISRQSVKKQELEGLIIQREERTAERMNYLEEGLTALSNGLLYSLTDGRAEREKLRAQLEGYVGHEVLRHKEDTEMLKDETGTLSGMILTVILEELIKRKKEQ